MILSESVPEAAFYMGEILMSHDVTTSAVPDMPFPPGTKKVSKGRRLADECSSSILLLMCHKPFVVGAQEGCDDLHPRFRTGKHLRASQVSPAPLTSSPATPNCRTLNLQYRGTSSPSWSQRRALLTLTVPAIVVFLTAGWRTSPPADWQCPILAKLRPPCSSLWLSAGCGRASSR